LHFNITGFFSCIGWFYDLTMIVDLQIIYINSNPFSMEEPMVRNCGSRSENEEVDMTLFKIMHFPYVTLVINMFMSINALQRLSGLITHS